MQKFNFKNTFYIFSLSIFSFALIYALNVYPGGYILPALYKADFALFTAFRFGLSLLILIYSFEKLWSKLLAFTITFFALGFVAPLVHLADAGDLGYVFIYIIFLVVISIIHLLFNSRFFNSSTVSNIISAGFLISGLLLIFTSIGWTKIVAKEYARDYVYAYLQCHPDLLTSAQYENICSNITGTKWQSRYNDKSIQDVCYDNLKIKKAGLKIEPVNCRELSVEFTRSNPRLKYIIFLTDYWNLNREIGLDSSN
jgi:hypothetical protein